MKLLGLLAACFFSYSTLAFASENLSIKLSSSAEALTTQHLSYNFGRVHVNSMNRVLYDITNVGSVAIVREAFMITGGDFSAYTNCPVEIAPGVKCQLEIRYWPSFEGFDSGRMQMLFTDRNDLIIDVYGEAYR